MKVLFLSPEAAPFAKTGGLADVAGSLPGALNRLGVDVRLVLPFYRAVREGDFEIRPLNKHLDVPLGGESLTAGLLETRDEAGATVYLLEREDLYDRPGLYGSAGGDYYDNLERFAFYAHAALLAAEVLPFAPDIIHCHDWQSALAPALLKGPHADLPALKGTASVFTIHNIGYPGIFPAGKLSVTGLPLEEFFHPEGLEYWGKMSLLKAGIVYSDAVTTVSPRYAKEIQTPEYGMGMEGILMRRRASLHGILNGVDYRHWDPARDVHLSANYSLETMEGKKRCKEALIREMGLDPSLKSKPLLGMITRLDVQKGIDLLAAIWDDLFALDVGLIVLGSGDKNIQQAIQSAAGRFAGRLGLFIGFNDALAHRIVAGADIFLIPSRYEPCGLTQMYALKYGTAPVVRATGGLDDTIVPFDRHRDRGNGFKFGPYEPAAFLSAVREAVGLFRNKAAWKDLMVNAMKCDFSWERSARRYLDLYQSLLSKK